MMQASPVSAATQNQQNQGTAASAAASGNNNKEENGALEAVDFQNFLTLLTAQLKHQDPLNPAESTEFVAQLAQFSSVEQLVNANTKLDSIASAVTAGGIDKYASWIGKQAEATDAPAYFKGDPLEYRISGSGDAAYVQVVVSDRQGAEVARFPAANVAAVQSWNGNVNGVAVDEGVYAVNAIYYDADGKVLSQEAANTFGGVREVRLKSDGDPAIVLEGGIEITPSQIAGLGLPDEKPAGS